MGRETRAAPKENAPVLALVRRHLSAPELKKLAPRIVSVDAAAATGTAAGTTAATLYVSRLVHTWRVHVSHVF